MVRDRDPVFAWTLPCGTPVEASYRHENGELEIGDVLSGTERVELDGYAMADLALDIMASRAMANEAE